MNPRAWRTRVIVPIELRNMLDEIYAIDCVLAWGFSSFAINDEDTHAYWDLNQKHNVESFFNEIPYIDFPKYLVNKATNIENVCDSILLSNADENLNTDVKICKDVCKIMMRTIINCWTSYYPVKAFGNESNKDYFLISSWNDFNWSKCPAYDFAKWLDEEKTTIIERTKTLFVDKIYSHIYCFFPECFPNNTIRVFLACEEGNGCFSHISFNDIKKVMKIDQRRESHIIYRLKFIDSTSKGNTYPIVHRGNKEGYIPVITSMDIFHLIQNKDITLKVNFN